MDKMERQLNAASGYLDLGMIREAKAELRQLDQLERQDARVLALRVAICQREGSWARLFDLSRYLACVEPGESQWVITSADAMCRLHSVEAAREMLLRAQRDFPDEAAIHYHLACYEVQLGDFQKAKRYLREAIKLDPAHRALARRDPQLAELRER